MCVILFYIANQLFNTEVLLMGVLLGVCYWGGGGDREVLLMGVLLVVCYWGGGREVLLIGVCY